MHIEGSQISPALSGWKKHADFLRCLIAGALNTGGAQIIRLAGNLILTRLLVPEAFGLMALVSVFLVGLEMFSDVGVGASIVHRQKKPGLRFLQTAWTLQALRGIGLWLVACAAAFPLAKFYNEPLLAWILPVSSFTLVLAGFKSTAIHLCARNLQHGSLTAVDLTTAVLGLVTSIGIALFYPSVWALVIGGLIAVGSNLIASWFFLPGQVRHRMRWHRKSGSELIHFGKWIFLGTVFAFLGMNGDRILLGKFLSLEQLGIYTVAFFFAQAVSQFMAGLGTRVLFPLFSRDSDIGKSRKYRRLLLAGSLVPIGVFLVGGPLLIQVLYDDRYLSAGSMLQILSLGAAAASLRVMAEPVLLAKGDSYSRMWLAGYEAILVVASLAIGGWLFGMQGFLVGYVVGQFLTLIPAAFFLRKHRSWNPQDDVAYLTCVAALFAFGAFFHSPFPLMP